MYEPWLCSAGGRNGSELAAFREDVDLVARDFGGDRAALLEEVGHQLADAARIHDRARESVRAHFRRLLEHGDVGFADGFAWPARGDRLVVLLDQVREVNGAGESRGTGADELHVELENFALHDDLPKRISAGGRVFSVGLRFEPAFAIDGRHAAAACGGDGLPVHLVVHVAGGEDALDVRVRRAGLHFDVALVVRLQLSAEERGVRLVADRDEHAVDRHLAQRAGLRVAQPHARHLLAVPRRALRRSRSSTRT